MRTINSKSILACIVFGPVLALGQTKVNLGSQSKNVDFSAATFVRPFRTNATLPSTCVAGEMFFHTTALAGLNTYGCVSANTWVLQGAAAVQGAAPMQVVRSNATTLTIGAACSVVNQCLSRFGAVVYSVTAPLSATVQSGSGLAYIYVSSNGLVTIGTSSGPVISCPGCQLQSPVTQFPVDSIPLASWNATSGSWDSTGATVSTAVSAGRSFTAGQNVTLAQSGSNVTISANNGYNPSDMTVFNRNYAFAEGGTSAVAPWSVLSATCTSSAGTAGVAGEPDSVGWGSTANPCFVYYPGANGSGAFPIADFISGATPKPYTLTGRYARGNSSGVGSGDHYIGWSSAQNGTVANFIGIRYLASSNQWQCVIRSAGADVAAPVIAVTPNAAFHTFVIANAGVANSLTCTIDSTSQTAGGTIPAVSWYAVMGTIISSGQSFFSATEARIQISGLTR